MPSPEINPDPSNNHFVTNPDHPTTADINSLLDELFNHFPSHFEAEFKRMLHVNNLLANELGELQQNPEEGKKKLAATSYCYLSTTFSTAETVLNLATTRGLREETRERLVEYFMPDFLNTPISLTTSPLEKVLESEYPEVSLAQLAAEHFGQPVSSFTLWEFLEAAHENLKQRARIAKKQVGRSEAKRILAEPELSENEYILLTHSLAQLAETYIAKPRNFNFKLILLLTSIIGPKALRHFKGQHKARIFPPGKSPREKKELQEKYQHYSQLFTNGMRQTAFAVADIENYRHNWAKAFAQHIDSIMGDSDYSDTLIQSIVYNAAYEDIPLEVWSIEMSYAVMAGGDLWLEDLHRRTVEEAEESAYTISEPADLERMFSPELEIEDTEAVVNEIFAMTKQYPQLQDAQVILESNESITPPTTASSLFLSIGPEEQAIGISFYEPFKNDDGRRSSRKAQLIFFRKEGKLMGGLVVSSDIKSISPEVQKRIFGLVHTVLKKQTQTLQEMEGMEPEPEKKALKISAQPRKGPAQPRPQPHKRNENNAPKYTEEDTEGNELGEEDERPGYMQLYVDEKWLKKVVDPSILDSVKEGIDIINTRLQNEGGRGVRITKYKDMDSDIYGFALGKNHRVLARLMPNNRLKIFFIGSHDQYDSEIARLKLG